MRLFILMVVKEFGINNNKNIFYCILCCYKMVIFYIALNYDFFKYNCNGVCI